MDDEFIGFLLLVLVVVIAGSLLITGCDKRQQETDRIAITNGCSQVLEGSYVLWKCD